MTVPKIAAFIDGANLFATAKSLGFTIDYNRLNAALKARGKLVRTLYYTAIVENDDYQSIRPLLDWLDYNGYAVVTKSAKEFVDRDGNRKIKGNMDVELTVDMLELAATGRIDEMYLFTGDGDFTAVVHAVQKRGVIVHVVSTMKTRPSMVADELRRQADYFIDLGEDALQAEIEEPVEKKQQRQAKYLDRQRQVETVGGD